MPRSDTTGQLALALSKAQGAMSPARHDRANPFYKSTYATLASVWDSIRKPLSDNELSVTQLPSIDPEGYVCLTTILMHSSGEWISADVLLRPTKADPQGIGSALTYARRYGLAAIVGVSDTEDDDANAASQQTAQASRQAQPAPEPQPKPQAGNGIPAGVSRGGQHWIEREDVRKRFWAWANQLDLSNDEVHAALNVESVKDFPGTMDEARSLIGMYHNAKIDREMAATPAGETA